jgi:hypothetical protein
MITINCGIEGRRRLFIQLCAGPQGVGSRKEGQDQTGESITFTVRKS